MSYGLNHAKSLWVLHGAYISNPVALLSSTLSRNYYNCESMLEKDLILHDCLCIASHSFFPPQGSIIMNTNSSKNLSRRPKDWLLASPLQSSALPTELRSACFCCNR
ncbi:hypothetical protein NC653_004606 [Populus alba x Populus x berolinensis]|uniref:Uncharacterized protein n=1 Tax=Populus alba x Populus x berolinensis TaxID=444605 RepID=A0AAD6RUF3_9ROSI|nr:hypothetical protein NC653_004606 [Populus alba x Populus x berolinensis]